MRYFVTFVCQVPFVRRRASHHILSSNNIMGDALQTYAWNRSLPVSGKMWTISQDLSKALLWFLPKLKERKIAFWRTISRSQVYSTKGVSENFTKYFSIIPSDRNANTRERLNGSPPSQFVSEGYRGRTEETYNGNDTPCGLATCFRRSHRRSGLGLFCLTVVHFSPTERATK